MSLLASDSLGRHLVIYDPSDFENKLSDWFRKSNDYRRVRPIAPVVVDLWRVLGDTPEVEKHNPWSASAGPSAIHEDYATRP